MTDLYEVIYVSHRIDGISDTVVIDEIVLPAGIKNRRLEITGCLWFSPKRFLQILEGPRDAVEGIYDAIQRDNRHHEINTVSSSPITRRSFSRWGMRALQSDEEPRIDELIGQYASGRLESNGRVSSLESESLLDQVRAYLVQLAAIEPVAD